MTFSFSIIALIVLITLPIVVLLWLTETKEQRAKRKQQTARQLRAKDYTFAQIAKCINMSQTTARNYCKLCAA
jgi:flagellar basal body-associated protein FliL